MRQKDLKVKELQAKRAEKLAELDQVKLQLEAKESELSMLYKEISKYDDGFHSGKISIFCNNFRGWIVCRGRPARSVPLNPRLLDDARDEHTRYQEGNIQQDYGREGRHRGCWRELGRKQRRKWGNAV